MIEQLKKRIHSRIRMVDEEIKDITRRLNDATTKEQKTVYSEVFYGLEKRKEELEWVLKVIHEEQNGC